MTLHPPCIITARLLPGVRVANGFISIERTRRTDSAGRTLWRYHIDIEGTEHTAEDLATHGGTQDALENLLVFLGAAAESHPDGENANLFPPRIVAWAYHNSDDLSMLACELEETKNLIEE